MNDEEYPVTKDLIRLMEDVKDSSDLYYISLVLLSARMEKSQYKVILPELAFLLNEESLKNLIYYFGGQTVRIPDLSEFRNYMYGILTYYYYDIKEYSWYDTVVKVGGEYSTKLSYSLKLLRETLIKELNGVKIPEVKSGDDL